MTCIVPLGFHSDLVKMVEISFQMSHLLSFGQDLIGFLFTQSRGKGHDHTRELCKHYCMLRWVVTTAQQLS